MRVTRRPFYSPQSILEAVQRKVAEVKATGESIDYLTFVPDGEPTLDANLGRAIGLLKPLGVKVAVITSGSRMEEPEVRSDLASANLVSLKIDAVTPDVWRRVNRPHGLLHLDDALQGILEFSQGFNGVLLAETMLVAGINDGEGEVCRIAGFLSRMQPTKAYVAVPTRPPAEGWVRPTNELAVNLAYQRFSEALGPGRVECLVGYEGDAFASSGDAEADLLSIAAVHPMRRQAVERLLARADATWDTVARIMKQGQLVEMEYQGERFYLRKLR